MASTSSTPTTAVDCHPSADTAFTSSAQAWIDTANRWYADIRSKYPRSISRAYDRLQCNGSIPFGWYSATHTTAGAVIDDTTPTEWMCQQRMDSPLAAMMVHTAPVMRPSGGPYASVLITYNWWDVRIAIGEGTEYAGCGVTADRPCVFRAPFPCVWPSEKIFDDGKGGPVAVVSGWDVKAPAVPHLRMEKE